MSFIHLFELKRRHASVFQTAPFLPNTFGRFRSFGAFDWTGARDRELRVEIVGVQSIPEIRENVIIMDQILDRGNG